MSDYAEGKLVRVKGTFTDSADTLVDPTVVKVSIQTPDLTVTTYTYGTDPEVIRLSNGVYYIDLDTTDTPGTWRYRWHSEGTGQTATTNDYFRVIAARPE